jgi:hypothetical protein
MGMLLMLMSWFNQMEMQGCILITIGKLSQELVTLK